jgi:probable rRNA maturation factor
MKLNILNTTRAVIPEREIKRLFAHIIKNIRYSASTINIVFVGDKKIMELNNNYRHIAKPTDVLSFNIDDDAGKDSIWGEIYISTVTAKRYAKADGMDTDKMIIRLCCHGLLHLMGYDHKNKKEHEMMTSKEAYYLKRIIG